jgi:predicted Zn-dependent peptidase
VEGRDYHLAELPSGRFYAVQNPLNDLFSLSLEVKYGSRHERNLCAALELLDLSGAGTMTAEEFKKRLFSLGTSLSYSCGEQESGVSLSGLNDNLWPSLELMRERFESPNIATDTLKRMVEVAIGSHKDNKKEPEAVFHALGEYARRGNESGVLLELTDKELRGLKTDSLKALLRGFLDYKRETSYVGNRSPSEITRLILEPGRTYKETPPHIAQRYQKPQKTRLYFTHRDMVQSQVGFFACDEIFRPEKAVDYSFLSSYLGGGMSSVVFQEVREARSLAYAAWGGYSPAGFKGDENQLYGGLGCQADKTLEATQLLYDLLRAPPFSEKRFRETAKAIEENYRNNPLQFREISGALITWADQGILGGDPRPERFQKILQYHLQDLTAFAERFKNKPMSIYILGHKDRLDLKKLKGLGDFEQKSLEQIFPY